MVTRHATKTPNNRDKGFFNEELDSSHYNVPYIKVGIVRRRNGLVPAFRAMQGGSRGAVRRRFYAVSHGFRMTMPPAKIDFRLFPISGQNPALLSLCCR
jgi:hypothetical protein